MLSEKTITELTNSLSDYEIGLQHTDTARAQLIAELRRLELESRRLSNLEEDSSRRVKQKRDELLDFQTSRGNKERLIDQSKAMIRQKREMVERVRANESQAIERKDKLTLEIN